MQVKSCNDRDFRAQNSSRGFQQVSGYVVAGVRGLRAVQRDEQSLRLTHSGKAMEIFRCHTFIIAAHDSAASHCPARTDRLHSAASRTQHIEKAAHLGESAFVAPDDFAAKNQCKILIPCLEGGKVVAFLNDGCDCDCQDLSFPDRELLPMRRC